VGTGNDQEGPGLYFTTSLQDACAYGEYIAKVRLNVPSGRIVPTKDKLSLSEICRMILAAPNYQDTLTNWDEDSQRALQKAIRGVQDYCASPFDSYQQLWYEFYRNAPQQYLKNIKLHDMAVIQRNGCFHAIVFHPEIIETLRMGAKGEFLAI
jgi:hypothetical protein